MVVHTTATAPGSDVLLGSSGELSPDDLDVVAKAFTDAAYAVAEAWTGLVGGEVEVSVTEATPGPASLPPDADVEPGASFLDAVVGPSSFTAVGAFGGDLGSCLLVVPAALGLVLVDLLLGGTGRPTGERLLSEIDVDLLGTITAPTFDAIRRTNDPDHADAAVPVLEDLDEEQSAAALASGATVTFEATVGDHRRPFHLVLGAHAARSLTGAAPTAPVATSVDRSREILQHVVADVVVEAVVAFPPVLVASHRILALDVGDVIGLGSSTDQPLPLRIGQRQFATVLPARAGGDVACQVVATAFDAAGPHEFHPDLGGSL